MEFGFPVEAVVILTVAVVASVWLDLFSHRNDEEVTFKNAAIWSVFGWPWRWRFSGTCTFAIPQKLQAYS